jgi:hypothetical protein
MATVPFMPPYSKAKRYLPRGRNNISLFLILLLAWDQAHSFVNTCANRPFRLFKVSNSVRLHNNIGSKNEEDYRDELKYLVEKQTRNAVMEALFSDNVASSSSASSSSSILMPIYLAGQARLPIGNATQNIVETLVLSAQQQRQQISLSPSSSSSSSSSSLSLLVPLNSRNQLKLVSFAAAKRPLSKSVLLGLNLLLVNRDDALFDNLPWSSWSVDPSKRNRDAAGNFLNPKFHLGKRDAYNRFSGKDWQGRSLAIGNMALRLKYMLLENDDYNEDEDEDDSSSETTNSKELALRILHLRQRELRMEVADIESRMAVVRNGDNEGPQSLSTLEKNRDELQQQLTETKQDMEELTRTKETLGSALGDILDRIADWSTDGGDNAAPYRGAMGYAPVLDSKQDVDDSLLPYTSPYDLLKEILDDQLNARVIGCVLENTSLLKGTTALGGAVVLQRKTTTKTATLAGEQVEYQDDQEDFGNGIQGGEVMIVECDPDEAVGVALACGVPIKVETELFGRSSVLAEPVSSKQAEPPSENIIDFLSMWEASDPSMSFAIEGDNSSASNPSPISIPRTTSSLFDSIFEEKPKGSSMFPTDNPIKSLTELDELTNESKAKTLLEMSNFNERLPRPRVVRNSESNPLDELLLPLIDESVRRQYLIRDAEQKGDIQLATELKESESRYQKAREQAEAANARGDSAETWDSEANFLASLRADVTQDEGAYSRFLDRDDWYERDRQATARRVKKSSFGNLLDGIE